MAAVGDGKMTPGAEAIVRAADRPIRGRCGSRVWGGANTLAQALLHVRATRTPAQVDALVARLRVYTISDQDDAGPWMRREFPALHYIATPSTPDGDQYASPRGPASAATASTGTARARTSRRSPTSGSNANIRSKGPLGKLLSASVLHHEGDTPSFLGLDRQRPGELR